MRRRSLDAMKTCFVVRNRSLLIYLPGLQRVLSSAPRGGGIRHARSIINHQVPANPLRRSAPLSQQMWSDPARYLGAVARRLRAPHPCVGLMTAVPLKQLVVLREQADDLWVEGFFTVGVTNAVRAGEPSRPPQLADTGPEVGTINMVLITNATLTISAMVTTVQVATESKTAVLRDQRIRSWTGRSAATGTGTDAVAIVSGTGPLLRYGGTHTKIGELVGSLVHRGVTIGLTTFKAVS